MLYRPGLQSQRIHCRQNTDAPLPGRAGIGAFPEQSEEQPRRGADATAPGRLYAVSCGRAQEPDYTRCRSPQGRHRRQRGSAGCFLLRTSQSHFRGRVQLTRVSSGGLLAEKESEAGCTGRLRPASEECGTPEKRRSELSHRAAAGTARLLRHQSTVQSRGIQKAGHSRKIYAYRHPDEGKHRLLF